MLHVPAICENCEIIFPSGIVGENSTVVINNVRSGPCSRCGKDGVVPDGYYDIKDKIINIFVNSDISIDRIRNIYKIINEAKNSQNDPDFIIDKIKNDAEELKSIFDLAPKTKSQLYGFLTLILTFIMTIIMIISMSNTQNKITKEDLKTIIDQMEKRLATPEKNLI